MDLYGKDMSNVSLPQRLQTINFDEIKLEGIIVNTQKCFYDIKIANINQRIERYLLKNILLRTCTYLYFYLVFKYFSFYFIFINMNSFIIIIYYTS